MENAVSDSTQPITLRARLAMLEGQHAQAAPSSIARTNFCGSLAEQGLHDLYAASSADTVTMNAFGLGLAVEAAADRPIVWALHEMTTQEAGRPYAPGLNDMGLRPQDLLLVRVRDVPNLLAVAEESLRSPGVGAVLLSIWGDARAMNLTASRRLAMAARSGGTTILVARAAAEPAPSAARSRWSVRAAPSIAMEANAPGRPAFSATRLRHRGGGAPRTWTLEWDRERRVFVESAPVSGGMVSLAAHRPVDPRGTDLARRIA